MFTDITGIIVAAGILIYMVRKFKMRDKYGVHSHHVMCQCADCQETK
jgi:hypothetical protein